jgi:serine/threonine protein kinase
MDPFDSSQATLRDTPGDVETGPSVRFPTVPAEPESARQRELSTLHVVVNPLLFGRYRRMRELGRGGMGVVWLAHDEVLGIPVALKLLPEEISRDPEELESLRKEVIRGIALTHAGIVRVFSFERDATNTGIVMEYVDGESLAQLKHRQPDHCFDPELIRPWLEQLCAVLDYAHNEARIAHRDLKPRNLMVTREGRLKVADFGIASSLAETMSGVSIRHDAAGTPPFMSPQQARGERPTSADDIYAVGATLYDLLTGKPPFFRGDIIGQLMHEVPQKMNDRRSELDVTGRAPIPPAWERVVAACLAKDPALRPPSGAALLQLLDTPAHALVPYEPRPVIPMETLRLNVHPVEFPHPAQEKKVTEAEIYPVRRARDHDGFFVSLLRGIGSAIGALFSELFLWTRRLIIAAIVIALSIGVIWLVQHLPKPAPRPTPAPVAQQPHSPFQPAPLNGAGVQPAGVQPSNGLQNGPPPGWGPPPPPPPGSHPPPPPRGRR